MDALVIAAEWFIGLFQEGGAVFLSLVGGIVPFLIVLLNWRKRTCGLDWSRQNRQSW